MGLYRRLFKGASGRDSVAPRSPEDARASQELSEELRDLKDEIRKLREALLDSPSTTRSRDGRRPGSRGRSSGGSRMQQGGSFSERGRSGPAKVPPDDAPTGPLVDYLKKHKVTVFEGQDDLARNEAFEHLARHLGQHFSLLGTFYEKLKRAVATGRTTRVDIDNYSEAERSAAVQLGTLLYRHGMLKDFYYHRSPRKQLRVIPNKDGETQQFLTGGWLEIYVVWLLSKRLKDHLDESEFQVLFNVKGTLPAGNEFEADLMASIKGRLLWLECKTGQWQDYSARFRGLVTTFGTERTGAGLVLIKSPDSSTKARATDMLNMTLLSLDDVETYVDDFLEIPKEDRQPKQHRPPAPLPETRRSSGVGRGRSEGRGEDRDDRQADGRSGGRDDRQADGRSGGRDGRQADGRSGSRDDRQAEGRSDGRDERRSDGRSGGRPEGRGSSESRNRPARVSAAAKPKVDPTMPEDATPLADAEPAKRLGRVQLEGEDRGVPRRRRRRRGRSRPEGDDPAKSAESLSEELPMDSLKGAAGARDSKAKEQPAKEPPAKEAAKATSKGPKIPAGMLAPKPAMPVVSEDKKAEEVEAKADRKASELVEKPAEGEEKARRPRRRRRPTRSASSEEGSAEKAASKADGEDGNAAASAPKEAKLDFGDGEKPAKEAGEADAASAEGEDAKPVRKKRAKRKARTSKKVSSKPAEASRDGSGTEDAKAKTDSGSAPAESKDDGDGAEKSAAPRKRAKRRPSRVSRPEAELSEAPAKAESSDALGNAGAVKDEVKPAPRRKRTSKASASKAPKETPFEDSKAADVKPARAAASEDKPAKAKVGRRAPEKAASEKPAPAKAAPERSAPAKAAVEKQQAPAKAEKRKSASGVTITPDLSAMMAGSAAAKKPKKADKAESKSED